MHAQQTDAAQGAKTDDLSESEVTERRAKFGYNELPEKKTNPLLKFLSYFWGPIPWMIEAAVLLSAIAQDWGDFGIILLLLFANAAVGSWEEFQAGNAIAALKARLALKAKVKRGGQWKSIAARELVPDDVIRVRLGDIVPADAALLLGDPIEVDQAALTGESLPVTRQAGETVYSGSVVRQGEIDAVVTGTGEHTYFGKTASLVASAHTVSHFQQAVLRIGNYLIVIALLVVTLILVVGLVREDDDFLQLIQFALVLTVAAIPVAMPTVLSVTMAVGARLLARSQAIVSRLVAVEELAGMDLLCSDKTGTLTKNQLALGDPFVLGSVSPQDVIDNAALASRAEDQDSIDMAVLGGVAKDSKIASQAVTHFQPFDPVHKRTEATVCGTDGGTFKVTKGAPQVILALSDDEAAIKPKVQEAIANFAKHGFRSLGVARCDGEGPWEFIGLLPLFDPPRDDSASTIATARQMGVDVKMVTGDQVAIGKEVAGQVGLGSDILDAAMFAEGDKSDDELAAIIEHADGFAQVFPEHKYRIVEVMQKHQHIVGMTGDGVNDAPALKKADAGIAVSGATDAARAAADIVLMSPGLSVIIEAIQESRKIFERMNSYAIYRIAETIRVLLFMALSIIAFNFYPVTAVMIVLLALMNDGAILSIAYDRVRYAPRPEAWDMTRVLGLSTTLGLVGVVESFGLFLLAEEYFGLDRDQVQTLIYLKLSVAGHLTVFVARTRGPFWSIRPATVLLAAVAGTQALATVIAVFGFDLMTPIGWGWAAVVWGYALTWFLIEDVSKLLFYRILGTGKVETASAL